MNYYEAEYPDTFLAEFGLAPTLPSYERDWDRELPGRGSCVSRGIPIRLHCFPAHRWSLTEEHRAELDRLSIKIVGSFLDRSPITEVHMIGHSATWKNISRAEYARRALLRAEKAKSYLKDLLAQSGLKDKVKVTVAGRADNEPIVDNLIHSSNAQARRNRAINRRVDIFLIKRGPIKRRRGKPNNDDDTDWNAFLNSKLGQLEEYLDIQHPFSHDRVHFCVRKMLLKSNALDSVVMPNSVRTYFRAADSGGYLPRVSLRELLITDLKKGYARGKIKRFWNRFELHVDNTIKGLHDFGFKATGQELYDNRSKRNLAVLRSLSRNRRHVYSCRFFKDRINQIHEDFYSAGLFRFD